MDLKTEEDALPALVTEDRCNVRRFEVPCKHLAPLMQCTRVIESLSVRSPILVIRTWVATHCTRLRTVSRMITADRVLSSIYI